MKAILDPHPRQLAEIFVPGDLARLKRTAEVIWGKDDPMPREAYDKVMRDVGIIICGRLRFGGVGEDEAPALKAIAEVLGVHPSPDRLDYETCFQRGIRVLSCAPAFAPMVAEMGLAHALAALRQLCEADRGMRTAAEEWWKQEVSTLYDAPVGMIGYGSLARALRPLLAPFRCKVSAFDPWLPDSYLRSQGVEPIDLKGLLRTSRVIFVLAIPSKENRAMLSRELLELIPRDSVFCLLSRSHVVDFEALSDLVSQGRFRAAIDVFPKEPLPADHPIRQAEFAVLTPHLAGGAKQARLNVGRMVADDVEAVAAGLPPMQLQLASPEFIGRRG
jgi:phosphoglycerate dehydrogenase-like enzyme